MDLLSKQEELIMLSVLQLKDNATLAGIRKYLVVNAEKDWAIGSIYVALSRLTKNGIVTSHFGDPTHERGGKAQKYFSLTQMGMPEAQFRMKHARAAEMNYDGIDRVTFMFNANKGYEPEELSNIASGGELSRLMLSVKSLISQKNTNTVFSPAAPPPMP